MKKLLFLMLIYGCQSPSTKQKLFEKDGFIEVEAEDFNDQQSDEVRKWVLFDFDPDGNHAETASNQAYLEVLELKIDKN